MSNTALRAETELPIAASHATRDQPVNDFFRHHGVWAPGVRLFRALGFRAKAAVISIAFCVPMAELAWSYFTDKAAAIEFSAKERVGVEYAQAVLPLLRHLQEQRLHAVLATAGKPDAAGARSRIDAAWPKLEAAHKAHGQALATGKAFDAAKAAG
jgi:hypothetical protein